MKQYLVIGLGSFGSNVAKTLYEAGEDVVGIDVQDCVVQELINTNTHNVFPSFIKSF